MRATKVVAREIDKPFTRSKAEWFIFYCLCSKIQMMINKATFMIAIPTNPKTSEHSKILQLFCFVLHQMNFL